MKLPTNSPGERGSIIIGKRIERAQERRKNPSLKLKSRGRKGTDSLREITSPGTGMRITKIDKDPVHRLRLDCEKTMSIGGQRSGESGVLLAGLQKGSGGKIRGKSKKKQEPRKARKAHLRRESRKR